MKISESQFRKIVKEEISKLKEAAYEPGAAVAGVEKSMRRTRKHDEWVNPAEGMTDDEIYDKVSAAISQIHSILEDVHELATYSPDNRNKGEGAALANLVHSIDSWYNTYGSGDQW